MSAVFDALKQEALKREEAGFTTTRVQPFGYFSGEDSWATANCTIVGSTASVGPVFVAYAAPVATGWSTWEGDVDLGDVSLVRSDTFFAPIQKGSSTMGSGSVLFVDFGIGQRGVVALDLPRKTIYSEEVTFYTANLKRKTPSAIIGGRDYGEENA